MVSNTVNLVWSPKIKRAIFMVSERISKISYAIREIAAVANKVAKSGKKIYHLNIGDPVIYDFPTPNYISQALADASFSGKNFYVDSMGALELREEINSNNHTVRYLIEEKSLFSFIPSISYKIEFWIFFWF